MNIFSLIMESHNNPVFEIPVYEIVNSDEEGEVIDDVDMNIQFDSTGKPCGLDKDKFWSIQLKEADEEFSGMADMMNKIVLNRKNKIRELPSEDERAGFINLSDYTDMIPSSAKQIIADSTIDATDIRMKKAISAVACKSITFRYIQKRCGKYKSDGCLQCRECFRSMFELKYLDYLKAYKNKEMSDDCARFHQLVERITMLMYGFSIKKRRSLIKHCNYFCFAMAYENTLCPICRDGLTYKIGLLCDNMSCMIECRRCHYTTEFINITNTCPICLRLQIGSYEICDLCAFDILLTKISKLVPRNLDCKDYEKGTPRYSHFCRMRDIIIMDAVADVHNTPLSRCQKRKECRTCIISKKVFRANTYIGFRMLVNDSSTKITQLEHNRDILFGETISIPEFIYQNCEVLLNSLRILIKITESYADDINEHKSMEDNADKKMGKDEFMKIVEEFSKWEKY
jgi:hypothetical protein